MQLINTFSYLKTYLIRYRKKILLGSLFITCGNAVGVIYPQIVRKAIDYLSEEIIASQLLIYAGLIVLITFGKGIFLFLTRQTVIVGSRRIENDFRNDVFAHLQKMAPRFYQDMPTGDIMSRMTNDLNSVRSVLGPGIMYSINTIVTFLFVIWMMLLIDPLLTLAGLLPIPMMAFMVYRFGKQIHDRFKKIQAHFSKISTKAQENLAGIRIIKSYVQEESEIEDFNRLNREYIDKNMSFVKVFAAFHPMMMFIVGLGIIFVLYIGSILIVENTITLGQFVAFSLYLGMLVWPSIALGWVVGIFQQGAASMERINVILNTEPDISDDVYTRPLTPQDINAGIEIRNLSFSYQEGHDPVLDDISVDIPAGTILAVVGRIGTGKTTLMNLLTRNTDPPRNTIFIDGVDIREIPLETLRAVTGYIPQETFLFSETIRENIVYGAPHASEEEIEEASKVAQIYDSIMSFADKFDTILGERGINLSGGQKQRVSIARAVIMKPKILLLDDALSAVDTLTEEKILGHLKTVMQDRTCIWISHRISAIKDADNIIVIDEGMIAEEGTHQQLVAIGGIYADLYEKQKLEEALSLAE